MKAWNSQSNILSKVNMHEKTRMKTRCVLVHFVSPNFCELQKTFWKTLNGTNGGICGSTFIINTFLFTSTADLNQVQPNFINQNYLDILYIEKLQIYIVPTRKKNHRWDHCNINVMCDITENENLHLVIIVFWNYKCWMKL